MHPHPDNAASQRELILRAGLGLLVFVLTLIPFYPAITAGYSDFDDPGFLLLNPAWRGVTIANLEWMFTNTHHGHYQPLTFLSYAIEYSLFHTSETPVMGTNVDLNPVVPHTTSIVLHAINAVLVFFLTRRVLVLARAKPDADTAWALLPSLLAALVWGLHPLRVESVAWITERRDVLSTAFLLACAIAYLHAFAPGVTPARRDRWRKGSIVLLLLSLLSKAWGITFFVLALLLDVYPLRRLPWQPWKWLSNRAVMMEKIPFAVLGVLFAAIAAHAQQVASVTDRTMKSLADWGIVARIAQSLYGLWFYVSRSFWPVDHALIRELPPRFIASEPRWWVAGAAVLLLGFAGLWASRRRAGLGVAILSYVILVAPVLGLAQSGIQLVAERYSYLALIPLSMALGAGIGGCAPCQPTPQGQRRLRLSRVASGVLLIACGLLAVLTWRQCFVWRDTRLLWEQSIASGAQGPIVHNFLARTMEKTKEYDKAIAEYQKSLDADPNFGDSLFGIGRIDAQFGRFAEAEKYLLLSEKNLADPIPAQLELGLLYRRNPATQHEALLAFQRAVDSLEHSQYPLRMGLPYLNLAAMYGEAGDNQKAYELLQIAVQCRDTHDDALSLIQQLKGP